MQIDDQLSETTGHVVWDADSTGFYYQKLDENLRPNYVYYHKLGTQQSEDLLIHHQPDGENYVGIDKSSDQKYLLMSIGNGETTEVYYAPLGAKKLKPIYPRHAGVKQYADIAHGKIYLKLNDTSHHFRVIARTLQHDQWEEFLPAKKHTLVMFDLNQSAILYGYRVAGVNVLHLLRLADQKLFTTNMPDPSYSLSGGFASTTTPMPESTIHRQERLVA